MNNRSTLAIATVILVILPLVITLSVFAANFMMESTGTSYGVLGAPALMQIALVGWGVVAVALVGALVMAVMREQIQHT